MVEQKRDDPRPLKKVANFFKNLLTNRTKCAIIIMLRETKTEIDPLGYSVDTLNTIWVCSSVGRTQNF